MRISEALKFFNNMKRVIYVRAYLSNLVAKENMCFQVKA